MGDINVILSLQGREHSDLWLVVTKRFLLRKTANAVKIIHKYRRMIIN